MSPEETARSGFTDSVEEVPFRAEMEHSFGRSFADVRAYRGPNARAAATALGARAYTRGMQIAFGEDSPSKEVVAHELTHVVQAGEADGGVRAKSAVSSAGDAHEREADRVGGLVASGQPSGPVAETAGSKISRIDVWDVLNYRHRRRRRGTRGDPEQPCSADLAGSDRLDRTQRPVHAGGVQGALP